MKFEFEFKFKFQPVAEFVEDRLRQAGGRPTGRRGVGGSMFFLKNKYIPSFKVLGKL